MSWPRAIVVTCPNCGDVRVPRDAVRLVISTVPRASRYSFECPRCMAWISKPADPPTIVKLTGLVPMQRETPPSELLEQHDGPPISQAELVEMSRAMARTDHLAAHAGF